MISPTQLMTIAGNGDTEWSDSLWVTESVHTFMRIHRFPITIIGRGIRLRPGMTLAIEPMITMGDYAVSVLDDDWTVVTMDGSLSAHYENTILITEGAPEILTLPSYHME